MLLCCVLVSWTTQAHKFIRIACVGNSITYGAGIVNREKNSYPVQLQNMLGDKYHVMNFGVSGTTLLRKGNYPYWGTKEYKMALPSNPDIVFIKLGTNDSKAVNRPYYADFEKDYTDLVNSFRSLPSHPRVVLLLPVPSFMTDTTQIYNPVIKEQIIPRIQQVAYVTGCEIINLYPLFIDKPELLPDQIHPSSLGATIIARRLYEVVKLKSQKGYNIFKKIKEEKKLSSFYGFECADFIFNNRSCKIVKPRKAATGLPWIWRARFWGHEPQTDIALLERGFHVVYCDVAELYGNNEAVSSWNRFYEYLQKLGLSKKTVLEGMSRGGIYVYNWALANPGKVACIYADAPVLSMQSWPGGKGTGPGSKDDWDIFKKDFGLTEEQALLFKDNPLDHAAEIAGLGFPMLHVIGDADEVVPVNENTNLFETKVREAGGDISVIHKPGVKHHPHSLENPTPIVDFILRATGYKINFAAIPAPGSEYRSGAGWKPGKDWWAQNADIDSLLNQKNKPDILFIGNSITQGIGGHRAAVSYRPGFSTFDSVFSGYTWECAGISGDRTQNVLWRLQHGNYVKAKPRTIVITIGVNNFFDDSPEEIADGIHQITQWTMKQLPSTKIILCGPLPAGLKKGDMLRVKYEKVQSLISREKGGNLICLSLTGLFIKSDGTLDMNYCAGDGIHLVPKGYEAWAKELKKQVDQIFLKE